MPTRRESAYRVRSETLEQMLLNGRQPSAGELVAGLERCSFEALLPLMPRISDVVLKVGRGRARARARAAHIPPHPPSLAGVCVV